jgi:hypothetical protein
MLISKVQCHGCNKWFNHRGLSQHISRTQDTRCRVTTAISPIPAVSSSIQNAATQPSLSPNCAFPVSRGGSPDEFDHTICGQPSDSEIAVTQGAHYFASFNICAVLPPITDDALSLEGALNDVPDPANVADADVADAEAADADAYEELLRNHPQTIFPDETTTGNASGSPEPTEHNDEREVGNQADITLPQRTATHVVELFPFGCPGMPIPDKPRGSSVYESQQATSMDSPWAPFQSQNDWTIARWLKMRGSTSTSVMELLALPGVRISP